MLLDDDTSYSWEGIARWTIDHPASEYTGRRSKHSAGTGYVLDFGRELNEKFRQALLSAYDRDWATNIKRTYDPIIDNCGSAFKVAINTISREIGVQPTTAIRLASTARYIQKSLAKYLAAQHEFPKR